MAERNDDQPIPELQGLRAPRLSVPRRTRLAERILLAAEPVLARRRPAATSWEVLARWARPGLIAASIALVILAGAWRLSQDREPAPQQVALSDVLAAGESGPVPALLLASNEPDADAVVAAALLDSHAGPDTQR